jgi:hypothetical protein
MGDPTVCAFCARPKAQVRNLIAGDGLAGMSVGICEACVEHSYDILAESGAITRKPAPAPAAQEPDAATAIRIAIRKLPRSVDVSALRALATAGIDLAAGNAAQLRLLAWDLGNAMAFEESLLARAAIASFERNVADSLAEAAFQTRIGNGREGVAVLDRLSRGPLAAKMTPAETAAATMHRMYAQLGAAPWDNDVRQIEGEVAALEPKLGTMSLDASYLRALQNEAVHVRARAKLALRHDAEAVQVLSAHLAVRELDLEALALLVEAYERIGDRASAARAREKALPYVPKNAAYAKRFASR